LSAFVWLISRLFLLAHQHPYTRGTVLITSKSAFDYPAIDPKYYGHQYDIDVTMAGQLWARKLAASTPMKDFMISETYPGAGTTGADLEKWFKAGCTTEYHIMGTCSMLPRDSGGVVDTNLIVYGTKNVRVVDASIMPLQVSAHLMAPAYGVAEKAADIVRLSLHSFAP
jgi:choline dehydrogenase